MKRILLLLILISHMALAQKSKTQLKAVDDLVEKLSEVNLPARPIRLAVVPLTSSVESNDAKNTFGEYLTETIIGKISENNSQFKVFERSRLDAIFKENELMLSGMMKPSEAIRIGELLPIDALFSGTYTKLKSYVDVSGRLIDVTSGEILSTYSGRIKMTKNIKTLFPDNPVPNTTSPQGINSTESTTTIKVIAVTPEQQQSAEEICQVRIKEVKLLLEDLSTPEKVGHIATEAMKTPFDNTCSKLHYEVMYAFTRYKIEHLGYRDFLLKTLEGIALPSKDDRAGEIIRFLCKDRDLNPKEWGVVLSAITRVEYGLYRYLDPVFDVSDIATSKNRIDEYFHLVNSQKLGLPQPTPYDLAFYQMMQGLGKNQELLLYTYEKYAGKLGEEKAYNVSQHQLYLNRMYKAEENKETKTKVLRWIAAYFQKFESEKTGEKLFDFAYDFKLRENKSGNKSIDLQNEETMKLYPESDLQLLISLCKDLFSKYATETPYPSQQEDRINFCLAHDIPVPGAIPSMEEADQILKGNDLKEQERIMKLLVQMGSKPKPLELTLIALFDKRSLEDKNQLITVQAYAIEVLGNIPTKDPKAINYMISKLMSYNYKENDNAEEALSKIGQPAVQPLMNKLKNTTIHDGGLRYKLVVLLGKNGKNAKVAEPLLLKIQKESTNKDILYAIEAALQAIKG
ncbi:MAG: FlgO family outer membrane protein [Cyclobacteriaceae bacterium]